MVSSIVHDMLPVNLLSTMRLTLLWPTKGVQYVGEGILYFEFLQFNLDASWLNFDEMVGFRLELRLSRICVKKIQSAWDS